MVQLRPLSEVQEIQEENTNERQFIENKVRAFAVYEDKEDFIKKTPIPKSVNISIKLILSVITTFGGWFLIDKIVLPALRENCSNQWSLIGVGAVGMLILICIVHCGYYVFDRLGIIKFLKSKWLGVK